MFSLRKITPVLFFLLVFLTVYFFKENMFIPGEAFSQASLPQTDPGVAHRTKEEDRTIQVYKDTNAAVVFISTISLMIDPSDIFLEVKPKEGTGSGFIIDSKKGIVVTNLHVIQDAQKIEIILGTGISYKAKLIGFDKEYDIALLQIVDPPGDLVSLTFADSSKVEVGQKVLAIGNPFGLNRSLTSGIISSLDRAVKSPTGVLMRGLLQTDAAINPGNSGGPLLDMDGRVIGVNTAILSQSGDSAGIGFSIPINQIKRFLPELIATGKVLRPKIGWMLVDTNQGPMVRRIAAGSPAEQAGINPIEKLVQDVFRRGFIRDFDRADLIVAVDGQKVSSKEEVEDLVSQHDMTKPLLLQVRRGGIKGPEREIKVVPILG